MRHPTEGTLRRLLDEPAGVADPDRAHVATCPACTRSLTAAREDEAAARAALDPGRPLDAGAVDLAWTRLSLTLDDDRHARPGAAAPVPVPLPARRARRPRLRSPLVAAVGTVVLLGGAGAAAANDWLEVFRTEQVATVSVSEADLVELPDLSAYGDLTLTAAPDLREVPDAAAAERATGLSAPQVDALPDGVEDGATYRVGDRTTAEFTFSAERAARAAAAGGGAPPPPPGLDGSRFRLSAGPGLATVWSTARGLPALVVARAVAPSAESSGVPFTTARDYLLQLSGLPDELAAQLRTFSGDGTTLPLPVPADQVTSSTTEVDGTPATVLRTRDGLIAGVVWVEDGVVTAVAGSLSEDEVLDVARGLE